VADAGQFCEPFNTVMAKMKEQTPDVLSEFVGLFQKVVKNGALPSGQNELIAPGIGAAVRCEPCICPH